MNNWDSMLFVVTVDKQRQIVVHSLCTSENILHDSYQITKSISIIYNLI